MYLEKIKPRMVFAHMRAALAYAETSYAKRLQVGCVVVDWANEQPVCIGWNGTEPGEPNVCEQEIDGQLVSVGVVHAEINALERIPSKYKNRMTGLVLFVSHSPCESCVEEIIKSGIISDVVYSEPYRIFEPSIKRLMNAGIEVYRVVGQHALLKHCFNINDGVGYVQITANPDNK